MTVRIRIHNGRESVKRVALFVGLTVPLVVGAVLLRPAPPKPFDFNDFDREQAVSRVNAQRGTRAEAADAKAPSARVDDLDKKISGTLVIYGAVEGSRR